MISIKNKLALSALVLTLAGASLFVAANTYAQSSSPSPMSSLVQRIADRFGLKKEDVQAVFDQERAERQTKKDATYASYLDSLVSGGKITNDQKQALIDKRKQIKQQRQADFSNMKHMTGQERKEARLKERQSLEDWSKQNNIDLKYLMYKIGNKRY